MSSQDENANVISSDQAPPAIASHKRRVRFPSDEAQLRMISIAPEPLANQPLFSLGVTLQRYRAACQRLQIRPLNCLLDQLNTLDDRRKSFADRLDCLRMVNERLDLRHIDAIEEILSRCRFHTLDVEGSFSDDATLVQFFDIIEYYESCTHLNLSNNRSINFQGYQALTRYMRKTRFLGRLDMNGIRFDDPSMLGFGRSLRMSSTLYELHVESCQLTGKLLQKLIQNIRGCPCLREVYLCDNRLQVQDCVLINELIRSCGQFLHVLDLRSNSLQDSGMSHIASQLSQYDEHHTHQNVIYKLSFEANQLTQQGVGFLAKSLLHNRTIRSLNLSHNQITNEGLFLLRDALLTNRTINELILRNCRLTDQAAIALAEFIAESSVIQYIDLRENNIQASGICGMAIAMKSNRSLLKVEFDSLTSNGNVSLNRSIDRTATQTNSLLSLSTLRRMTVGLGGLTNTPAKNSQEAVNPQNTRELYEQKAKWLNDIDCICQRNLLLHEDQLRRQEEEQAKASEDAPMTNGAEDALHEVESAETVAPETNGQPAASTPTIQANSEDATNGVSDAEPSNATTGETEQVANDNGVNEEPSLINSFSFPPPAEDHLVNKEEEDDDDDDAKKRQIHHSDSLYLLRKRTANESEDDGANTSDDESQISSIIEPTPTAIEGVQTIVSP